MSLWKIAWYASRFADSSPFPLPPLARRRSVCARGPASRAAPWIEEVPTTL